MIDVFRGDYYFLSNFWPCPVEYEGVQYKNSEAAYQAQKCPSLAKSFTTLDGSQAKKLGRTMLMSDTFSENKIKIMYEIVKAKFEQNKDLAEKLILTYDHELYEGNYWNDKFWGIDLNTRKGQNNLGRILMSIRADLITKQKMKEK